ncbi:MAG TPA: hypothetical protein VH370_18405, partial [Humisphaera sp.]|nr:hypothetical protein [Humisphaera sp.]
ENGGGKLEAAIVTYKNRDGVTVHLDAALHVAEKAYYDGMNKTFEGYDVLLYEMVKPKDMPPPEPGFKSGSTISSFQRFLKDVLALDFQLDDIDYTKPNFVNADLDYETFSRMQTERGESILGIMLQSMLREMSREAAGNGKASNFGMFELLVALRAPDRARQLKLLLGRQFDDIEDQMAGLTGPNGSVIITERNKAALDGLKKAIADGKKNIGIFYGAGHMREMESRLMAMGFKQTSIEWRVGWDMSIKAGDPTTRPIPFTQPAGQ